MALQNIKATPESSGSAFIFSDSVAQLVEQQTLNLWVLSSSLSGVTNYLKPLLLIIEAVFVLMAILNISFPRNRGIFELEPREVTLLNYRIPNYLIIVIALRILRVV